MIVGSDEFRQSFEKSVIILGFRAFLSGLRGIGNGERGDLQQTLRRGRLVAVHRTWSKLSFR